MARSSKRPTYAPRARYRTRRSAAERVALDPSRDFGATALDRPQIAFPIPKPRRATPPRVVPWYERRGVLLKLGLVVLTLCAAAGCCVGGLLAVAR